MSGPSLGRACELRWVELRPALWIGSGGAVSDSYGVGGRGRWAGRCRFEVGLVGLGVECRDPKS